ncbi:hypothetical protein FOA52_006259 [Chlamydomonas sp. UWO 241]|nr:hypothetical protein FOA52_006259 [Chlamydomonas sp. UWO 241]
MEQPPSSPLDSCDFDCAVCCDTLLDPVVAPCGHDMCNHCYQRWLFQAGGGGETVCPLCRCFLPRNLATCIRLKRTIAALQPEAVKRRRVEVALEAASASPPHPEHDDARRGDSAHAARAPLPTYPPGPPPPADLLAQWAAAMRTPAAALSFAAALSLAAQPYAAAPHPPHSYSYGYGGSAGAAPPPPGPPSPRAPAAAAPAAAPRDNGGDSDDCTSPRQPREQQPPAQPGVVVDAPAQQPQQPQRWQCAGDGPARLVVARSVVSLLRARGLGALRSREKSAAAVRVLELMLYRGAPTRDDYLDATTLAARVEHAVESRLAAARAARAPAPQPLQLQQAA